MNQRIKINLKEDHELSKCENDEIKNLIIKEKDKRKFEMVDIAMKKP